MQSLIKLSKVLLKLVSETFSNSCFKAKTSSPPGASATNPFTIREIKGLRKLPKVLSNSSVRSPQGICFKELYESSK